MYVRFLGSSSGLGVHLVLRGSEAIYYGETLTAPLTGNKRDRSGAVSKANRLQIRAEHAKLKTWNCVLSTDGGVPFTTSPSLSDYLSRPDEMRWQRC